jgi:hypothetical protein
MIEDLKSLSPDTLGMDKWTAIIDPLNDIRHTLLKRSLKSMGVQMTPERPDLMEIGTRYNHYMELRELFAEGAEILSRLSPQLKYDGDYTKQKLLEETVKLIDGRMELLGNYRDACYKIGRVVDALPVQKRLSDGEYHGPNIDKCAP